MKKFIETYNIKNLKVKTNNGYKDVKAIHKTIKYNVYKLNTESFELECADNHIVLTNNGSEYVKNLKINDLIYTTNGLEPIKSIIKTDKQEYMYDLEIDTQNEDEKYYYTNNILSHNTTMAAFYLLYEATFPIVKGDFLIVAHKQSHAKEVLKRMKDMYYSVPLWMKPGVVKNNELAIEFDVGIRVIAEATTATAARGKTLKIVYCVDGNSNITIRNKNTKKILNIPIKKLFNKDFK